MYVGNVRTVLTFKRKLEYLCKYGYAKPLFVQFNVQVQNM